MARTYREIAMEEMLRTVEEAMSQVINWAAIDSVDLLRGHSTDNYTKLITGKGVHESGYDAVDGSSTGA